MSHESARGAGKKKKKAKNAETQDASTQSKRIPTVWETDLQNQNL